MLAWRLCRAPFADLSGEGARLFGGRWNHPGRRMVYAAETAALAVLEMRVHLDVPHQLIPDDYVLMTLDLDEASIEVVANPPADPAGFGTEWVDAGRTAILQVPSFIVEESSNLLINPAHPDSSRVAIDRTRPFRFDERLWQP